MKGASKLERQFALIFYVWNTNFFHSNVLLFWYPLLMTKFSNPLKIDVNCTLRACGLYFTTEAKRHENLDLPLVLLLMVDNDH